jgi:hypothetical protein
MSSLGERAGERIKDVRCTRVSLIVDLVDGRTLSVPIVWYPRLLSATPTQRANWRLIAGGFGIHWPDVDEDLSIEGLLRGAPAPRPSGPQGQRSHSSREASATGSLRKPARPTKRKSVRRATR